MLKTIKLFDKLAPKKSNNSKSASSKNDGSKPAFKKNNNNGKVRLEGNDIEYAKKLRKSKSQKTSKLGILKSEKTSKSLALAKLGKKL